MAKEIIVEEKLDETIIDLCDYIHELKEAHAMTLSDNIKALATLIEAKAKYVKQSRKEK